MGERTFSPKRTSEVTDPPRWLIPWTSAFFTSRPARKAAWARMTDAVMTPCPPSTAKTTFRTSLDIHGLRARGARARPCPRRLRGLLVLADVCGGEDAGAPRDDDRELAAREPVDEQLLEAARVLDRIDDVDVGDADGAGEPLDRELAGRRVRERAAGAGVLLLPSHRGRAVVEHDEHVAGRGRVVGHLDEPVHAGVDERRVADDRHDAPRVLLREHVAEAEADAERGAHRDAGVHPLVGREDAERVAADVAGHDAVELPERAVDRVVRAGLAELRRLPLRRLGLGREVLRDDAPDAVDVQLAEAERLGLRLDRDPRGADRVGEDGVALLHHDAAPDRPGERADLLEGERVRELQLEEARLRGGLRGVA